MQSQLAPILFGNPLGDRVFRLTVIEPPVGQAFLDPLSEPLPTERDLFWGGLEVDRERMVVEIAACRQTAQAVRSISYHSLAIES